VWAQQSSQGSAAQKSSQSGEQRGQSGQQAKMAAGLISAEQLKGKKVMDAQNRNVGEITNLFVDPKSGRIQRADIDFDIGPAHKYSVSWDKLKVRQQGNDMVVTLDESIVKRVQQAGASGRAREGEGLFYRDYDVAGIGDAERAQQRQISASQLSAEQIRKIQQKLNQEGFHAGQVDGKWSNETQTAIRNFQQNKGLQTTGQLDEKTVDELGLDADEFRQQAQPANQRNQSASDRGSSGSKSATGGSSR
jgi:sporulation protein YlmC with PRC-barrel domain